MKHDSQMFDRGWWLQRFKFRLKETRMMEMILRRRTIKKEEGRLAEEDVEEEPDVDGIFA